MGSIPIVSTIAHLGEEGDRRQHLANGPSDPGLTRIAPASPDRHYQGNHDNGPRDHQDSGHGGYSVPQAGDIGPQREHLLLQSRYPIGREAFTR